MADRFTILREIDRSERVDRRLLMLAGLIFFLTLFFLLPQKGMSPVWSVPYFSGAKEWTFTGGWLFQPLEVDAYKQLKGWDIYFYSFNHFSQDTLSQYGLNSTGYLYGIIFSQLLFPFLGPVGSIVLLQILVHLIICYVLYQQLSPSMPRAFFLFGYAVNPLVLFFVVYPFYYFWQVLPSFVFLIYYFRLKENRPFTLFVDVLLAASLFIGLVIRNTTILMVPAVILILWTYSQKRSLLIHCLILVVGVLVWMRYFEYVEGYGPWHNAFIGFAGYPNKIEGLEVMNDNTGYAWYNKYSGKIIDASIEGNFTTNLEATRHYYSYMKDSFLELVHQHPAQFLRNMSLNFFQGFAAGYITKGGFLGHLASAFMGILVVGFFLVKRAWIPIIIIAVSHITYSVYYPPIPAYLFGTYLLIVCFLQEVFFENAKNKEGLI
jgi:hypothetical protein